MQFFNMKNERQGDLSQGDASQQGANQQEQAAYQEVRTPAPIDPPSRFDTAQGSSVTPLPVSSPAEAPTQADTVISTIISEDITIEGNVTAEQGVCLEGTIQGDLRGKSVVIGRSGSVTGSIIGNEVAVYGRVLGSIQGKNVMLYKSAHVEGDVLHQGIGIEMGSHYDGRLKWDGAAAEPSQGKVDGDARDASTGDARVAYNAEASNPRS